MFFQFSQLFLFYADFILKIFVIQVRHRRIFLCLGYPDTILSPGLYHLHFFIKYDIRNTPAAPASTHAEAFSGVMPPMA